jgi:MerR family transcriptional regulator, redox-sensitive transcriptional activator SoxR
MNELTIGEVARRTGVRASALRFYESEGVLPKPLREGRHRRYDPRAVRMVEVLRFAQDAGFSLQEIKTLFQGFGSRVPLSRAWEALATEKLKQLDELQRRVEGMRSAIKVGLRCGCIRLEDCMLPGRDRSIAPAKRRRT